MKKIIELHWNTDEYDVGAKIEAFLKENDLWQTEEDGSSGHVGKDGYCLIVEIAKT